MNVIPSDDSIKGAVRQAYGNTARRLLDISNQEENDNLVQTSCCGSNSEQTERKYTSSCCSPTAVEEAQPASNCCGEGNTTVDVSEVVSKYYLEEEISGLPESVTGAALGCGNPTVIADLQPGEVVLDLGSGGGIDCFIAAKKVGPEGKVIGLDMTPDMVKLARRNAQKIGVKNVDFRYGEIENIPLPDESVDIIISNCVINLSPDKDAVFREAFRVLHPGGRISVSDIVTDGEIPSSVRSQMDSWAGCVAGALEESVYLDKLRAAGFEAVEIVSRDYMKSNITEEGDCQTKLDGSECCTGVDFKIASVKVTAHKPV